MKFEVNCCIVDKNRISRKKLETLREKSESKRKENFACQQILTLIK